MSCACSTMCTMGYSNFYSIITFLPLAFFNGILFYSCFYILVACWLLLDCSVKLLMSTMVYYFMSLPSFWGSLFLYTSFPEVGKMSPIWFTSLQTASSQLSTDSVCCTNPSARSSELIHEHSAAWHYAPGGLGRLSLQHQSDMNTPFIISRIPWWYIHFFPKMDAILSDICDKIIIVTMLFKC